MNLSAEAKKYFAERPHITIHVDPKGDVWEKSADPMHPDAFAGCGQAVESVTVAEHQALTVQSYLTLCDLAPEVPWAPVLQGWTNGDYYNHVDQYAAAGVDLAALPVVGLGSVCRRQHLTRIGHLILMLDHLKLHGFGFKTQGLRKSHHHLASADSLAWSFDARKSPPLLGHTHKNCANCLEYALSWRTRLLASLGRNEQGLLDLEAA